MNYIQKSVLLAKYKKLDCDALLQEGYEQLQTHGFDEALVISQALKHHRNTGAFEIGARALWGIGKYNEAIKMLEEAAERFPQIYIFRDYLASFYSDLGNYDEALRIYSTCFGLNGAEDHFIQLNQAIVYGRMGNYEHALSALGQIVIPKNNEESEHFARAFQGVHTSSLLKCGRLEEAMHIGEGYLAAYPDNSSVLASLSKAALEGHNDRERAVELAYRAVRLDKSQTLAFDVIRCVRGAKSAKAVSAKVVVNAVSNIVDDETGRPYGFFASYGVVFEDASQIIPFIEPIESKALPGSLSVASVKNKKKTPDEWLGVEWAYLGYTFYTLDEA